MATQITHQVYGTANIIIATESTMANVLAISIDYTPFFRNIAANISTLEANIGSITTTLAKIDSNVGKTSSATTPPANYFSDQLIYLSQVSTYLSQIKDDLDTIATQQSTLATKVSSIENMANGDHGIHFRQPHQWNGGQETFTSIANISTIDGNTVSVVTVKNISE